MEPTKMNEALQIFRAVFDMITALKRPRPQHWDADEPPRKRIRLEPFQENGAKAVKMPENHVILFVS
uniref:Uncharacterized protein n=1 Tax=viral metagenome TaxID=1070528 RepID=A0A6C0CEI4_9ZZZZ